MALMSLLQGLTVDRGSEVPLGTQIAWKLRMLIAAGALSPGARLPGVREVAESAGVNVNTIRSVFARLEEQGLLASEQGRGTFVAAGVRPDANLADVAKAAMAHASEAGVDPRELAAALYVTPHTPPSPVPVGARLSENSERLTAPMVEGRAQRRALRTQIARLERELAQLEPLGPLEARPGAPAGRILNAVELREIRDNLMTRVEALHHDRQERRSRYAAAATQGASAEATPARPPRWRHAGVWTGRLATGISWTASYWSVS